VDVLMEWVDFFQPSNISNIYDWVVNFPLQYINKADRHDITEIMLKVALNTIPPSIYQWMGFLKIYQ
jgi:hypothetical protein